MKIIQIFLCSVFFSISVAAVRYDNFALYRIFPRSIHDLNIIRNLQNDASHNYDFWTDPISLERSVDILVHPEKKHMLNDFVKTNGLNFQIITDNMQERIDEEATMSVLRTLHDDNDDLTWDKYNDLDTIYRWLKKLAKDNPDKVTLVEGGRTYENRSILGVKISFGTQQRQRTAVWIDSQIHAREWISGATSTYILNAVLYSDDPNIRTMAENHDWYFFPVINPDGYVYTYTSDRLWRKTRTPYKSCYGADPNRNWDYKWNQGGSSDDPCDDTYAGPSAFSEIETKTLADYMANVADELLLFLTFHSYSQLILIPYGHTTEHLDNYNITYPIGLKAADKLSQRYGTQYTVGDIAETIYVATGSNMDWIKGNYHIPFAYCYELRDTGKYGFILPPEQIIPTALETLDSIATILEEADKSN